MFASHGFHFPFLYRTHTFNGIKCEIRFAINIVLIVLITLLLFFVFFFNLTFVSVMSMIAIRMTLIPFAATSFGLTFGNVHTCEVHFQDRICV